MKKIIILAVLIAVLATGFAAAQGFRNDGPGYGRYSENDRNNSGWFGDRNGFGMMQSITEVKTLSGELVIRENDFPALKTGKEEIAITLPADAIEDLKMKNGSKLTVKGIEVPAGNWSITGEKILKVFELEFEGKEYLVHGGMGMPGRGMMGGGRR